MQRKIPYTILFGIFISTTNLVIAQKRSNPYKAIGKEMEIIDISKGRYEETILKDSLERIGSVIINRYTRKIESLLDDDSLNQDLVKGSSQSRFLSVDPLTRDYAELTPYQFASNRPIDGIDLDGEEFVKAPNPKATALLIVGGDAGEKGYSFPGFYYAARGNNNIDVMKATSIQDINKYLSGIDKKYENIIIADHGYSWAGAGQTLSHSSTDSKVSYTGYREADVIENEASFQNLQNYIQKEGSLVLLGCFTAAPQLNGSKYLSTMSLTVNRPVYGNMGESTLSSLTAFTNQPIGERPTIRTTGNSSYFEMGVLNAGLWSKAFPNGKVKTDIGNLRLSSTGAPLFIPPTMAAPSKLPSLQQILKF
jgi:hypothetical protein